MDIHDDVWARADAILDRALDEQPERRAALIADACGDDAELAALVQRLLRNAETQDAVPLRSGGALDGSLGRQVVEELGGPERSFEGEQIGSYRILREIGRGGMSVVYLGERVEGGFSQQVAVKVIQSGIADPEATQRFARERQILADARHPDIARLLDGGVTQDGQHYLVMEFVEGLPIDDYCERERRAVSDRVRLVVRVARAVASAHRSLVVHRDIKPSNVLVTAEGEVKLLDFGIAKLLDSEAATGELTRTGAVPMTPAFAAPEQVRGEPVTTATDVYQLGVLLYLLLTGTSPHGAHGSDALAFARAVVEEQPRRLWDAFRRAGELETRATSYDVTASRLQIQLGGDLEAVVMKALSKRPQDRHGSADGLVADLESQLAGRPVSARPLTFAYRARLFARRHWLPVAGAALLLAMIGGWTITTAVQGRRIATEADRANREARTAQRVADFLTELFAEADPERTRGGEVPVREVLDRGRDRLSEELIDEPAVRAQLDHTLGAVYHNLGLVADADALYREALELREQHLGSDHPLTLQTLNALATTSSDLGRYQEARDLFERSAEASRSVLGEEHPDTLGTLNNLAVLEQRMGLHAEARQRLEELLVARRRVQGPEHRDTLQAMMNLGIAWIRTGEPDRALPLVQEARTIGRRTLGDDHPWVLEATTNEAVALSQLKRYDEAEPLYRRALADMERVLGPDHPSTLMTRAGIAKVDLGLGRHDDAARMLQSVADGMARVLGPYHPTTLRYRREAADAVLLGGDVSRARRLYEDVLSDQRRALGESSSDVQITLYNLACLEVRDDDFDAAVDALDQAVKAGLANSAVLTDDDLKPLHGHPRYERLADQVRDRIAQSQER